MNNSAKSSSLLWKAVLINVSSIQRQAAKGNLDEMESRWRNGDWQNIHPIAHKARSSISMLGMKPLLEDVLHIERTSRSGLHEGDIGARIKTARVLLELALEDLREDRAKRSERPDQRGHERPRRSRASAGLRRA